VAPYADAVRRTIEPKLGEFERVRAVGAG
jgi:hypothetical protein